MQRYIPKIRGPQLQACVLRCPGTEETLAYSSEAVRTLPNRESKCYPARFFTTEPNPSPEVIEKLNNIPRCQIGQRGKRYLELPIGRFGKSVDDDLYRRGDPGPHRILTIADYHQHSDRYSNVEYCLTMIHIAIGSPEYVPCSE